MASRGSLSLASVAAPPPVPSSSAASTGVLFSIPPLYHGTRCGPAAPSHLDCAPPSIVNAESFGTLSAAARRHGCGSVKGQRQARMLQRAGFEQREPRRPRVQADAACDVTATYATHLGKLPLRASRCPRAFDTFVSDGCAWRLRNLQNDVYDPSVITSVGDLQVRGDGSTFRALAFTVPLPATDKTPCCHTEDEDRDELPRRCSRRRSLPATVRTQWHTSSHGGTDGGGPVLAIWTLPPPPASNSSRNSLHASGAVAATTAAAVEDTAIASVVITASTGDVVASGSLAGGVRRIVVPAVEESPSDVLTIPVQPSTVFFDSAWTTSEPTSSAAVAATALLPRGRFDGQRLDLVFNSSSSPSPSPDSADDGGDGPLRVPRPVVVVTDDSTVCVVMPDGARVTSLRLDRARCAYRLLWDGVQQCCMATTTAAAAAAPPTVEAVDQLLYDIDREIDVLEKQTAAKDEELKRLRHDLQQEQQKQASTAPAAASQTVDAEKLRKLAALARSAQDRATAAIAEMKKAIQRAEVAEARLKTQRM